MARYEWLEEIARGANGIVYRARDLELDREVALKTLRPGEIGAVARERFLREARIAGGLHHPNIVPVFEAGEHEGRPFYTMPVLEGKLLTGPLPPAEACVIMAKVSAAVAHAHGRGIIHRDLKPANVIVCGSEPIVTDFGVARVLAEARVTETGALLGTPVYMAPEQIRGQGKEAGTKADVYALGVMLYELLTSRLPHEGESFLELSGSVLNDPAPELIGFDPSLASLVRRCLAKDPAARPDAADLARRLERWVPSGRRRWPIALGLLGALVAATLWAGTEPAPPASSGEMARIPAGLYEIGDPRFGRTSVPMNEFWIDRREAPARAAGYSYLEALAYCLKQDKRLPTEVEWEVAAGGRLFPWGDDPDPSRASCQGARGPNLRDLSPLGVQDMAGHLAEWTATPGRMGDDRRVVRGGHWQSPIEGCTTYARTEVPVTKRLPTLGFRCASSVEVTVPKDGPTGTAYGSGQGLRPGVGDGPRPAAAEERR